MDKYQKDLCRSEAKISKEQFLGEIFLYVKSEYIAKTYCNGEYIKVELLNGQTFKIKVEEI